MFTEICIQILYIVGTFCSDDPNVFQPSNDCWKFDTETLVCHVEDIRELPARASYYDPELCVGEEWNTNCYYDENGLATWEYLGDGTPTAEGYGLYMACPTGLYGAIVTFQHAKEWQCRDNGSAIVPNFGKAWVNGGFEYSWYITFDFLLKEAQWWNYQLIDIEAVVCSCVEIDNTISKNVQKKHPLIRHLLN